MLHIGIQPRKTRTVFMGSVVPRSQTLAKYISDVHANYLFIYFFFFKLYKVNFFSKLPSTILAIFFFAPAINCIVSSLSNRKYLESTFVIKNDYLRENN